MSRSVESEMLLFWILLFSLTGTAGTLLGASLFLATENEVRRRLLAGLLGYAVGTLLGVAFLRLLPHALERAAPTPIMATVLGGIVGFFILEKFFLWRHCHEPHCEIHSTGGSLILIGDGFHNFVDGILIAAALLTSIPLGIATALAIILHEVPQEVGDFSILLDQGYSRGRALALNLLSSTTTIPGALIGYFMLETVRPAIPFVLAVSSASFIYIATVDLIADMHRRHDGPPATAQFLLLAAGVATIALLGVVLPH